jgi:hypothetical protein
MIAYHALVGEVVLECDGTINVSVVQLAVGDSLAPRASGTQFWRGLALVTYRRPPLLLMLQINPENLTWAGLVCKGVEVRVARLNSACLYMWVATSVCCCGT